MTPTHKFNNGNGATLCKACRTIITTKLTSDLLCTNCQEKAVKLLTRVNAIINLDSDNFTDGEIIDTLFNLKINEFLIQLEDEES